MNKFLSFVFIVLLFNLNASDAQAQPELSIPSQIPADAGATVTVPVDFTQDISDINSTAFSVDYDENNLTIDPTITIFPWPDAITIHPDILNASFFWTIEIFLDAADIDGELDVLFTSSSQLVPEGDLITITFDAANVGSTTEAAVNFSQNPIASFGNTVGESVPGVVLDGSVLITVACTPTGISETICNGIDDDCDNLIDEDFAPQATTCGLGACAATGQTTCSNGVPGDTCTPGSPSAEICDNLDNDCDGSTDETLTRLTTCGVGQCSGNTGEETCSAGTWGGDTCDPLAGATAEVCDDLDNDCDGSTDENLTRPTTCGVGECSGNTGEEICTAGTWGGDTCDPLAGATAELCDNLDNDCDGSTDENLTRPTTCGVGACAGNTGEETCAAGTWGNDTCDPLAGALPEGPPGDGTCEDTVDNDCDGQTDLADPDCEIVCTPSGTPETVCNGVDDDCDSAVDEDFLPQATTCGVGECASTGQTTCIAGVEGDTCTPGTGTAEVCDNLDNDCDGSTDENLARPTTCGVGACAGNTGEETCAAGTWGNDTCDPLAGALPEGPPGDGTCEDTVDNDCDGQTDLADPDCEIVCTPTGTPETVCNGVDDDCDGAIDEDYMSMPTTCGVGECASTGQTTCIAGVEGDTCTPGTGTAEVCDNLDNDCDGSTDENLTRPTTCGVGACVGNTGEEICTAGTWGGDTCDPLAGATAELCDNLDNDCDGSTDETLTRPTTCGVGACAGNTGEETCAAGTWGNDTCDPLAGAVLEGPPGDGTCSDTVDNDCDGQTDLADPDCEIVCTPSGTPETVCNGVDDDCDGAIDEDYISMPTTCGVGECASTGQTTCIAGVEGDTCTPGTGTAEVCDNLDNDCDGSTDENLARPTTCGVGACAGNTGEETCAAGTWGNDTCDPLAGAVLEGPPGDGTCSDTVDNDCDGQTDLADPDCEIVCTPSGTPETVCNGVDDDCDGAIDEDYMSMPTTCGVGECAATGQIVCVDGVESDTCTAGKPQPERCDGLDNDCDGAVDDGIAPVSSTCGIGECQATGTIECVGGQLVDSCTPSQPSPEICDGLDNDCNGAIDDDPSCAVVDLDIARFRVSQKVKSGNEIKRIQLTVKNPNGGGEARAVARLIGMQNGTEVYNKIREVWDRSGNGRSRFAFPSFKPEVKGTINWTVTIEDDDGDDDTATASTNVKK